VTGSLALAEDLRAQIAREAGSAFPRECCGLIEGTRDGAQMIASVLHPMRNMARDDDRFEIDPTAHIALLKKLHGTGRAIIGCYHSHPGGRAEPSACDREAAEEAGFLWLIQAAELRGFVWNGVAFAGIELALPALA
jgi:proteasome lid subunit RPN8/RPN11